MTEHDRIEARNAAASDYLRRRHQARLEHAHRVPDTGLRWKRTIRATIVAGSILGTGVLIGYYAEPAKAAPTCGTAAGR